MANSWTEYQEEVAAFFRSVGLDAVIDATVDGVRTSHAVDILVTSHHVGFDVTWVVECKLWQRRVSKLHVLALRQIVTDLGVDRGILLSESGFQSGALEAANLTNVHLSSLGELRTTASAEILAMRLRECYDRITVCKERYWDLAKETRIRHGLRPEPGTIGYSGARVAKVVEDLLTKALRGIYPFSVDSLEAMVTKGIPEHVDSPGEVLRLVESLIGDLESKLRFAEEDPRHT